MSKQKYPQTSVSTSSSGTTRIRPIKKNGYTQVKNHAKQDRKRHEAYARQDKYDSLSISKKLEALGTTGSNRERARLLALMPQSVTDAAVALGTAPKVTKAKK